MMNLDEIDLALQAVTRPRPPRRQRRRCAEIDVPNDPSTSPFLVTAKVGQRARASVGGREVEGTLVSVGHDRVALRTEDGALVVLLPRTHAFVWSV